MEGDVGGPAVIFDVDGVLSDASVRQHFLEGWGDWDGFFDACGDDPLIADQAALTRMLSEHRTIVLLTSRPDWVQPQTLSWLHDHREQVHWDLLVMRSGRDFASASSFKRKACGALHEAGFVIELALDDDPRNIAMYRGANIPAIYIESGYY